MEGHHHHLSTPQKELHLRKLTFVQHFPEALNIFLPNSFLSPFNACRNSQPVIQRGNWDSSPVLWLVLFSPLCSNQQQEHIFNSSFFSQILFGTVLGNLQCPRELTRADISLSSLGNTLLAFSTRGLRQLLQFPLWCVTLLPESWAIPPEQSHPNNTPSRSLSWNGVMPAIPGLRFGNHLSEAKCFTEKSLAHLEF